jgi:hypothetical protein
VFADRLCEELVLLDEDISFLSKFVKAPEVDIYKSNKGLPLLILIFTFT